MSDPVEDDDSAGLALSLLVEDESVCLGEWF